MAEEDKATEAAAPVKSKRSLILLIVAGILLLGVGGIGTYMMVGGDEPPPSAEAQEAAATEGPATFGPLVELMPLVANLSDANGVRYVKITLNLEVEADNNVDFVTTGVPAIRSALLVYFADVRVESTLGSENKERIRGELRDLINRVLGTAMVSSVYFTEFVVQ